MAKGTINRLMDDRGFGFIKPEGGGPDVFFHANSLARPLMFGNLEVGQQVEYEVGQGAGGRRRM